MFETTEDLNLKYGTNYLNRPLNPYEFSILNGDCEPKIQFLNFQDAEIINSLLIYYEIEMIKNPSNYNKYIFFNLLLNLVNLKDIRGYLRLGNYYQNKECYLLAINFYEKCIESECIIGKIAKIKLYEINKLTVKDNKDISFFLECLKLGIIESIYILSNYYINIGNIKEGFKYLEYGIYKKCAKCFDNLFKIFINPTLLYIYLLKLNFSNFFIFEKMKEIKPTVNFLEVETYKFVDVKFIFKLELNVILIPNTSKELIDIYN